MMNNKGPGYVATTLVTVALSAFASGCGLSRNRYEHHINQPELESLLTPYTSSNKPPKLEGEAVAMLAKDYKAFAEAHNLQFGFMHTIRPQTRLNISIRGKPEYNQVVHAIHNIDLYGLGTIEVLGRPLNAVRREIERGYARLLGVREEDIAVNLDRPVEGENILYALVTVFDEQGGKMLKLTGPTTLEQTLAAAGMPKRYHEWNEIALTRRLRDKEGNPTTVQIPTANGNRNVNYVVIVADMEPLITGQGDVSSDIPTRHKDKIYIPTEGRPWTRKLADELREIRSVTTGVAGIGMDLRTIDGVIGYFEKPTSERR
jgi:hypothetical protein